MADTSVLDEKIATLAAKVDELVAQKTQVADDGQAAINNAVAKLDEILARIP